MSHGYYYSTALTNGEGELLAGVGVDRPVGYEAIMSEERDADMAGPLRDALVSCWQLDEPSGAYAYDKLGMNNLHWGYWYVGAGPGVGGAGFPAVRFTRTLEQIEPNDPEAGYYERSLQYVSCDDLASAFSDSRETESQNYRHRSMTLIALIRPTSFKVAGHPHGLVTFANATSNYPYRMWELTYAYHRDDSTAHHEKLESLYGLRDRALEDTTQHTCGGPDQSAHVLCTVWKPGADCTYWVTLYIDDPVSPYEEPHDLTGQVEPITFDRLSFGAIRRSGASVIYPFDGYLGILVLVPRAVSDEERILLMQWVKATAGLV